MNDRHDIEHVIESALEARAAGLGVPDGGIDSVFARADRRRSRRRTVAAAGSIAAVGLGVFGVTTLGAGDESLAPGSDLVAG